jgi:cellobiose phosphorylase
VDESGFRLHRLANPKGLEIAALPSGLIYSITGHSILVNQILPGPIGVPVHRLFLRILAGNTIRIVPIIGANARSCFSASPDCFNWYGEVEGIRFTCSCCLHPTDPAWRFDVALSTAGSRPVDCDLVMVQDVGLGDRAHVRRNELFCSQYLDHRALPHTEWGWILLTRQNLQQHGKHPFLVQGCFPRMEGFTTDGLQFFGTSCRANGAPAALQARRIGQTVQQGELAWIGMQSDLIRLDPSATRSCSFFGHLQDDHPAASGENDLEIVEKLRRWVSNSPPTAGPSPETATAVPRSVFQSAPLFPARTPRETDLRDLYPDPWRHIETLEGQLASFFTGSRSTHVVSMTKELAVRRPHGHILRAGRGFTPEDRLLTATSWACGVFLSQVTVGNTSINKMLSGSRDPLLVQRSSGLRIFVKRKEQGPYELLGLPSVFEMTPDGCCWHYLHDAGRITVSCRADPDAPIIRLHAECDSCDASFLVSGEIAASPAEFDSRPLLVEDPARGRLIIRPGRDSIVGTHQPGAALEVAVDPNVPGLEIGGSAVLIDGPGSVDLPYFHVRTGRTRSLGLTLTGHWQSGEAAASPVAEVATPPVDGNGDPEHRLRIEGDPAEVFAALEDTLTWFARDAMVHLSTPTGLEQPGGGAWGVRDVCQGPIEFLLSYDQHRPARDVLCRLFARQHHQTGDWPQWFMFPPYEHIRSRHSHGDVLVWPLFALCDYLEHSDDGSILQELVGFVDESTGRPTSDRRPVLEHVERLLARMESEFLPGLALPRYGEGDWDDSLQPSDSKLRDHMVSSWTTELLIQALRRWVNAAARFGLDRHAEKAQNMMQRVHADFQRHLMPGGVVAGFAIFENSKPVEYLLHPSDTRTGLHYRLIPMTRGIISEVFDPRDASRHLSLIRKHLLYPDGARLMDRPVRYQGGVQTTFCRAESAASFGREIGLQYVHAHLRYAEATAKLGLGEDFWHALQVVNPILVTQAVRNALPRQRNCYFSSSDAMFADRYAASRDYELLRQGEIPVDAGWRIYSSGAGIYTSLVIRHLFGVRRHFDHLVLDPVLPPGTRRAACELSLDGKPVRFEYHPRGPSGAVTAVQVNGKALGDLPRVQNPYRAGGVLLRRADLAARLDQPLNVVKIEC